MAADCVVVKEKNKTSETETATETDSENNSENAFLNVISCR